MKQGFYVNSAVSYIFEIALELGLVAQPPGGVEKYKNETFSIILDPGAENFVVFKYYPMRWTITFEESVFDWAMCESEITPEQTHNMLNKCIASLFGYQAKIADALKLEGGEVKNRKSRREEDEEEGL